jgi:hypothetical protein
MRTLDDIVPPSRRKEAEEGEGAPARHQRSNYRRRSRFPLITIIVALLVIAGSAVALFYFSNAEVEITPNVLTATVQNSFTATQGSGDLPFVLVSAQKIATQSVQSTGTQNVMSAASGNATVFNTQSSAQRLIATTRFATPSGLIFRIHSAITVPAGTTAKPGSVVVTLYADQAGDSYNVGPSSFTVPGLAGTPQADKVYAQSTAAMTGGASGAVPVVSADTEAATRTALKTALAADLENALAAQIPSGYVVIPGAATTTFSDTPITGGGTTGMADVKEQGTITAVAFPGASLAKAIATSVSGLDYHGEPLTLSTTTGLSLSSSDALPTADTASYTFTLSGTVPLTYTVDPTQIAAAVAGKTPSAAEVALTNFAEVKHAIISLHPFWRQTFPQDPTAIHIVVTGN